MPSGFPGTFPSVGARQQAADYQDENGCQGKQDGRAKKEGKLILMTAKKVAASKKTERNGERTCHEKCARLPAGGGKCQEDP